MTTLRLRRGPAAWIVAAGAGLAHALAAGWPTESSVDGVALIDHPLLAQSAWLIQWLAVAAWAAVLFAHRPGVQGGDAERPSSRRAAGLGWVFGTSWLCGATWWLYISMHHYGHMAAPLAATAVVGLAAALSLYQAAAAWAFTRWHRLGSDDGLPGGRWRGVAVNGALFGATWMLAELARALIFTGFPWAASGYAHLHGPLAGLAPWIGVYGIGLVAATTAAWAVALVQRGRAGLVRAAAVLALAGLSGLLARHDFTAPAGELAVSLLQGNVPQDQKFDPKALPAAMNWYVRGLTQSSADLVVAPETALPLLPEQLPDGFWARFSRDLAQGRSVALTGMPQGSFEAGYANSVIGLGPAERLPDRPAGQPYRYDKVHLVPFGEFIPAGFRWFLQLMDMPLGDFSRGSPDAEPLVLRTYAGVVQRIAPMICFEDLFGEELARRFRDPARAPTVLVNVSNLGWFDDSPAIAQHLRIAQMRGLELQRPTARATNTGATVLIDHQGRLLQSLAPRTQGVLAGLVEGRTGTTPYAWWTARAGLWPLILLGLAIVAPCIVARSAQRLDRPTTRSRWP